LYVTFYYIGGSLGGIITGWTWVAGGWPACVVLLMGVAAVAMVLAFVSSRKQPSALSRQPAARTAFVRSQKEKDV
jgi:sugar phosphate permease